MALDTTKMDQKARFKRQKELESQHEFQKKVDKAVVGAAVVGGAGLMTVMFKYPYKFIKWFFKIIIINPWGNVVIGVLGSFMLLGQYFGWIDPSAESSVRQIELDGNFDWTGFGVMLVLLTVGIFRLVWGKVRLGKSLGKDQSED